MVTSRTTFTSSIDTPFIVILLFAPSLRAEDNTKHRRPIHDLQTGEENTLSRLRAWRRRVEESTSPRWCMQKPWV